MNKKLTIILLVLTIILLGLLAIVLIDTKNSNNNVTTNETDSSQYNTDNSSNQEVDSSKDVFNLPQTEDTVTDIDNTDDNKPIADQVSPTPALPIVLAFAGDINFDEDSKPVARYDREGKGILGGISKELVYEMNMADIFMLNNEFAYSVRGTRIAEKSYTFRAHPKRVDILKEMGADIVSLANNHALDFGVDALIDTFATLDEAGIDYVGAGNNIDRAKAPIYYNIGDTRIAYLAASRVIYAMDWYATDDRPGMTGTYDPTLLVASIKEAKDNSDLVVVYVHWGVERTHELVDYQKNMARSYIDAGADIVIGCHPHVMQGLEFYKGKPIAYSLGNYWFNSAKRESGLLKYYSNSDGTYELQLLPAMNDNTYTYLITDEDDKKAYYEFMERISFNVKFDEDGFISEQ
jgi:poly-gamma-glutamate synthesis protein (capsule biosynthesis protein)